MLEISKEFSGLLHVILATESAHWLGLWSGGNISVTICPVLMSRCAPGGSLPCCDGCGEIEILALPLHGLSTPRDCLPCGDGAGGCEFARFRLLARAFSSSCNLLANCSSPIVSARCTLFHLWCARWPWENDGGFHCARPVACST